MNQQLLSSPLGGSFSFSMLPIPRMNGARFGITQAYVNAEAVAVAQGSPSTIMLSRDARVDVFRGNQLLQSFYLSAGVHQLNTTSFPEGSYLVSLRVYETGVYARTEDVPFNKASSIAADRQTQWFMQAGREVDETNDPLRPPGMKKRSFLFHTGSRFVLPYNFVLTSGLAAISQTIFNEARLDWQRNTAFGNFSGTLSLFFGNDGSHGNSQNLSWSKGLSMNLYRSSMCNANCKGEYSAAHGIGCQDSISTSILFPIQS